VQKLKIEGIGTVVEPKRTYPQRALAAQLIGSVGTDNYGLSGLEQSQDETLRGSDGERKVVKDALGEPVSIVEAKRAKAGKDLRLTIDAAIQERVEAVLDEVGKEFQPRGSTALVLDPRTGQMLAVANWPRVDANSAGQGPAFARQNRAVAASYEPGSTFKAFTMAGAIQQRLVAPATEFNLPPTINVADRKIGEAHPRGPATLSASQILAQSSNVGSVKVGLERGARRFERWVRRFGFGRGTGIDLPGEAAGIVPRLRDYSGSSMGNLPIGQGLAVTPLQMATAYTAIANHGVMRKP
jgi:cell division protein FtsI (penicillin-binding protein 3)